MKHGKRPTVRQKKVMSEWRLNVENWLVERETTDEMIVVHRHSGTKRTIRKKW